MFIKRKKIVKTGMNSYISPLKLPSPLIYNTELREQKQNKEIKYEHVHEDNHSISLDLKKSTKDDTKIIKRKCGNIKELKNSNNILINGKNINKLGQHNNQGQLNKLNRISKVILIRSFYSLPVKSLARV